MRYRFHQVLSALLVLTVAAAPTSAAVVSTAPPSIASIMTGIHPPPRLLPRAIRSHGRAVQLTVPSGCKKNGSGSFVGGGLLNNAGTDAGVLAGTTNEACDTSSGVVGGSTNTVGGDGSSLLSVIAGGASNGIEGPQAFIGGGTSNLITFPANTTAYTNAIDSAIVSGQGNSLSAPLSFIGGGYGNTIFAFLFDGPTNGLSSFIGAGANNLVEGAFSGVVSGTSNIAYSDYSTIAGGSTNTIQNGATEGGTGSPYSFIGGGASNSINASLLPVLSGYNVIAGGQSNIVTGTVENNDAYNAISGGRANVIGSTTTAGRANAYYATIGGGSKNMVNSEYGTIGGGSNNTVTGTNAFVGGGNANTASGSATASGGGTGNVVTGANATVSGGVTNTASGFGAVVAGGSSNKATNSNAFVGSGYLNVASGNVAALGGGYDNVVSGAYATVPGGAANTASGTNSFAAGTSSNAATTGAFVWSDDAMGATVLKSTASNQFLARASGGFRLYSNRTLSSGVSLNAGSGTWSSLSDRNMKTNVTEIDPSAVLAKVAALPITEWSYRTEDPAVRHVGPMAQDFYAAFGVGEDNRHITTIDEEGVALAAIKALQAEVAGKNRQITELQDARQADEGRFSSLEKRLELLEKHSPTVNPRNGV